MHELGHASAAAIPLTEDQVSRFEESQAYDDSAHLESLKKSHPLEWVEELFASAFEPGFMGVSVAAWALGGDVSSAHGDARALSSDAVTSALWLAELGQEDVSLLPYEYPDFGQGVFSADSYVRTWESGTVEITTFFPDVALYTDGPRTRIVPPLEPDDHRAQELDLFGSLVDTGGHVGPFALRAWQGEGARVVRQGATRRMPLRWGDWVLALVTVGYLPAGVEPVALVAWNGERLLAYPLPADRLVDLVLLPVGNDVMLLAMYDDRADIYLMGHRIDEDGGE